MLDPNNPLAGIFRAQANQKTMPIHGGEHSTVIRVAGGRPNTLQSEKAKIAEIKASLEEEGFVLSREDAGRPAQQGLIAGVINRVRRALRLG